MSVINSYLTGNLTEFKKLVQSNLERMNTLKQEFDGLQGNNNFLNQLIQEIEQLKQGEENGKEGIQSSKE